MPLEECNAILQIDSVMTCRGNVVVPSMQAIVGQQLVPVGNQQAAAPMQQMFQMMMCAMQQANRTMQANGIVEVVGDQRPKGRPMRSMMDLPSESVMPVMDKPSESVMCGPSHSPRSATDVAIVFTDAASNVKIPVEDDDVRTPVKDANEDAKTRDKDAADEFQDGLDEVRRRMLARPKPDPKPDPKPAAAKAKVLKRPAAAKAKVLKKPIAGVWKCKPSIGVERTRKQVMCRSGQLGKGSTHRIQFAGNGGEAGAMKKAKVWLANATREYKAAGHDV